MIILKEDVAVSAPSLILTTTVYESPLANE